MKGAFINCPWKECGKMMLKNAYLRPGSYFTMRCYHCGVISSIVSENGQVVLKVLKIPEEYSTDDDDSDIVTLRL